MTILPPPPSSRTALRLAFSAPTPAALPRDPADVPYTPRSERETVLPPARKAA